MSARKTFPISQGTATIQHPTYRSATEAPSLPRRQRSVPRASILPMEPTPAMQTSARTARTTITLRWKGRTERHPMYLFPRTEMM